MDDSGCTGATHVLSQSDLGIGDLALSRLSAQLGHDLDDLSYTGSADRVSPGLQTAGGVDSDLSSDQCLSVHGGFPALPFPEEAQVLDRQDLRDGEVVMHLGEVDVLRGQLGLLERPVRRDWVALNPTMLLRWCNASVSDA